MKIINIKKTKMIILLIILSFLFLNETYGYTGTGEVQNKSLGINLTSINDYSTQLPFINIFKTSRAWMTSDGSTWDTGEYNKIILDENGYPKSFGDINYVHTLLLRSIKGTYKTGKYYVFFKGEGTLGYRFSANKIGEGIDIDLGKYELINVIDGDSGIDFQIRNTDPNNNGDYIRDIKIIHEDFLDLYKNGEIFNPDWIDAIKDFGTLRFMDWMNTNSNNQIDWADRPKETYGTYAGISYGGNNILHAGAPVEVMVKLANKLSINPWFNLPHKSTLDYQKKFAEYIKENLNEELKAYFEFSNETWNWIFPQSQYGNIMGRARWGELGPAYLNRHGMKTAEMCDIIKGEVFNGNDSNRAICTIAMQTANKYTFEQALNCPYFVDEGNTKCYEHNVDLIAITGYFNSGLGDNANYDTILGWIDDQNVNEYDKAIEQLLTGGLLPVGNPVTNMKAVFDDYKQYAKGLGLKLGAYEGGQHITALGNQEMINNDKLTNFFVTLNHDPRIYDIYKILLDSWYDPEGIRTIFNHYSDVNRPGKYGSWGSLDNLTVNKNKETSPKYAALIDWMKDNKCFWGGCENIIPKQSVSDNLETIDNNNTINNNGYDLCENGDYSPSKTDGLCSLKIITIGSGGGGRGGNLGGKKSGLNNNIENKTNKKLNNSIKVTQNEEVENNNNINSNNDINNIDETKKIIEELKNEVKNKNTTKGLSDFRIIQINESKYNELFYKIFKNIYNKNIPFTKKYKLIKKINDIIILFNIYKINNLDTNLKDSIKNELVNEVENFKNLLK